MFPFPITIKNLKKTTSKTGCSNTTQASSNKHSMFLFDASAQGLHSVLLKMKHTKSCGSDFIVWKFAAFLLDPLLDLISCSFREGVFPQLLKLYKIKPIFKKGGKNRIEISTGVTHFSFVYIFELVMKVKL